MTEKPPATRAPDALVDTPLPPRNNLSLRATAWPSASAPHPVDDGTWPEFPGFRIVAEIGRGGTGVVYRAYQEAFGREVAIKVSGGPLDAGAADLLTKEGRALARLNLDGVVRVYDKGTLGNRPYLVLEYHPNGSLEDRIRSGPAPAAQAAVWTARVARSLADVHAHKIWHRDLKPANVLIAATGCVCVTDFGIAKARYDTIDGQTRTEAVGTPAYMAPEQVKGRAGAASDVYGTGAILYALLTGRPPFVGATVHEVLAAVRTESPPPPNELNPSVPPGLADICMRCLEKEPGDRYPSAEALAEALERWLSEPRRTRRPGSPRSAARSQHRRRAVWPTRVGVLFVSAILTGMVGAAIYYDRQPKPVDPKPVDPKSLKERER